MSSFTSGIPTNSMSHNNDPASQTRTLSSSSNRSSIDDETLSASRSDASASQSVTLHSPSSSRTASVVNVIAPESKADNTSSPFSRLLIAHVGAALALFLATTDATIVSTSLPTIIADLHASKSQYSWVGVAYAVPQTALQPLYGQFSDLLGRKTVLYSSLLFFMIGSLLCGLAPNYVLLCIFRAIAGVGGGGIVSAVWLITSELVDENERARWSQALSVTWSASAVAGPLLGGVFSDSSGILSWRWAFLINIPVVLLAWLLLYVSLRMVSLRSVADVTWTKLRRMFDFLGLLFFICGSIGIILGFSFSSQFGWTSPATLVPLIMGCVILIIGSIYEKQTTRDALFPSRMFDNVTVGTILVISFLHQFAFNAGTFFLALYYQAVNGSSALDAGMRMLPYSLGSSLASMPAAWFISYRQGRTRTTSGQKAVIVTGLIIATAGFGLLIVLSDRTPAVLQEIAPLIAGIGIGMLFHSPYQVLIRALRPEDIARATGAFFLVRFTGATCGLAIASAIFNGRLSHSDFSRLLDSASSIDLRALAKLQPPSVREEVLRVVSSAIQSIWIVCSPCLALALLISPLIKVASADSNDQEVAEKQQVSNEAISHT